jgi:hypothetical protein
MHVSQNYYCVMSSVGIGLSIGQSLLQVALPIMYTQDSHTESRRPYTELTFKYNAIQIDMRTVEVTNCVLVPNIFLSPELPKTHNLLFP